jgi:MinD-like ATPase involved in chromosome partitioning or flagellar assembly
MRRRPLLTWFDIKRKIARETANGNDLPDGIVKISCFSSALEIGIQNQDDQPKANSILKEWFGDWYQESEQIIQLDIDNASIPVEFILIDNGPCLSASIRPFWQEVAYLKANKDSEQSDNFLANAYQDKPEIIAFYSFKGGVGRTLHLAAYILALLARAKEINKPVKILVIDSDLEAPGLTYWQRNENQEATVSLSNFLEVYQYPKPSLEVALSWVTQEIKKTAKQQNKSTLYFLPAFIEEEELLDTPILPENLARNPSGAWEVGDAIHQLGQKLAVDYIFIDLRAGLSEISSPILFDSRIQRFLVTTVNEQSWRGVRMVLEKIGLLAPSDSKVKDDNYYDPSIIISFLTPEVRNLSAFENILEQLQSAYVQPKNESLYTTRLDIKETDFAQELLYVNNWDEAQNKLSSTSLMELARQWAEDKLSNNSIASATPSDNSLDDVKKLRDTCNKYIYAEKGEGEDLLITEPLKNLARNFQDKLPNVISIGAKGAGKTFNYIQLSRLQSWENFLNKVDPQNQENSRENLGLIFPLLQSKKLDGNAKNILKEARENVMKSIDNQEYHFTASDLEDKITQSLSNKDWNEVNWANFWIREISTVVGYNDPDTNLQKLNHYLQQKNSKIIFLFDGLEDAFPNVANDNDNRERKALKALIDHLPNKLSEIRQSNLGLIVFLRRDFLRYTITQNSQQFESLYGNYDLSWNLESFLKLSYWLCIQSSVINANPQDLFDCSIEDLKGKLERLWGKKLGADNAREAKSDNWIFAALTDFNGRLQARDIVRFLYHAANITVEKKEEIQFTKWSNTRLLPPQAIRRALKPCSEEKVDESKEEYPIFKIWVQERLHEYSDKKIPFSLEQFNLDATTVNILEQMGVIYEDKDKEDAVRYYMPEIFREGLGFSSQGARPRVLALKRKVLGKSNF